MMRLFAVLICLAPPLVAQEFTTLKGHGGPIMDIAVSGDGRVATASFDNTVGLWQGRAPVWLEGHDAAVTVVETSPGLGLLSGSDDFRVLQWKPESTAAVEISRHKGKVSDIAITADGSQMASASWDGSIHLGPPDGKTPRRVLTGHESGVNAVGFDAGNRLYSASSDGTLRLWDEAGPRPLVKHGFGINTLIVAEKWLAYGAVDGGTRVLSHEGEEIADFTLDRRPILSMAYHAETRQLAVGDGQGYIMMIDTGAWRITRDFRATRSGPVWALAFSPDGATIWAGGLDDLAYGWPVEALDAFDNTMGQERAFLRAPETMPNGERQFMRKCSICHALEPGPSRKAGPSLHGIFGRRAGTLPEYRYSDTLKNSPITWDSTTIDALFDQGPDHYIPGSKMPMQIISAASDRADLVNFLRSATQE
ncbi:c-type cytochrome [Pacificoceanicola onchidii]|uniref:c-type cytochrome n=1 Tax=Pacificoceanicola onchidii TaxID=2562685 RepID=UPI0010A3EA04|nr:c-type cytochrome [Pacificoceanicola onchidii]